MGVRILNGVAIEEEGERERDRKSKVSEIISTAEDWRSTDPVIRSEVKVNVMSIRPR